ncbi:MAG: hypothetical protein M1840_007201 [Geoglossum simile]|nr:MAG: hypothetical protein M1840_007201 [Geoglossum simile]
MEEDATQLGGTQKTRHQLTRKRRHNGSSTEPSEPIRKSPRLRMKVQSRLQRRHNLNQQLAGKPARWPPRTAEARRGSTQGERHRPDYKSSTSQVAHNNQLLPGRKRKRTVIEEEQSVVETSSPLPPWRRAEPSFQSQQEANTAFWDSLSKVWLTKRALEEFNRRTARPARPVHPAPIDQRDWRKISSSDQIKHFARHGGPELGNLRRFPEPTSANSSAQTMASSRFTTRTQDTSTNNKSTAKTSARRSSAYDHDFEQKLIDHSIYPDMYDYPHSGVTPKPNNWKEINSRLAQPRPSLSPSRFSEGAFDDFRCINKQALSEAKVMSKAFPIIAGNANIPSEENLIFTNLEPLTGGTLVDAQPDLYDGARPEQIDQQVRKELGSYIIPSTHHQAPSLPNLFAEGKGRSGSAAVAERQACYDGALGARGIYKLQSYRRDGAAYDNNAYTISATYHHDDLLKMYTTHPTQQEMPKVEPEYHTIQLGAWALTGSSRQFREGAGTFRNARDWAKEQRDKLIVDANSRVVDISAETSTSGSLGSGMLSLSTIEPTLHESDTSADELALDMSASVPLPPKCLKGGLEKCYSKPDQKRRPKTSSSKASRRSRRRGRSTQIEENHLN